MGVETNLQFCSLKKQKQSVKHTVNWDKTYITTKLYNKYNFENFRLFNVTNGKFIV